MEHENDALGLFSKQRWTTMKSKRLVHLALVSMGLLLLALIVYTVVVPVSSTFIITRLKELKNDTHILRLWLQPPMPQVTKLYAWNLTNADDVSAGRSAPVFKQVGPYVYEQWTEKLPSKYKKNSIVYFTRSNFIYRPDLTHPSSQDDIILTLHAGLYGAVSLVNSMAPSMISMVNQALPLLFPGVDSLFVPVRVGSYLFDGVVLNCSNNEGTIAEMVCNIIPNYAPPTIRRKENSPDFLYSLLAHKNNTLDGPYEEDRGLEDILRVGQLMTLHNSSQLGMWESKSECDKLRGHDVFTFPPFIQKTDGLEIYIPDICQKVTVKYQHDEQKHDLLVYKYGLTKNWLGSLETNPDNGCYCLKTNDSFCDQNGIREVSTCTKAPLFISHPHFYLADDSFREYAQGMNPDPELHNSIMYIEPQTGTPVVAYKRLQFNMNLRRIKGFPMSENVTEGIFPLVWLEEGGEITEELLRSVKTPLYIQKGVKILSVVVMSLAAAISISLLVAFCFINRLWCCGKIPTNQVTALFYRHSQDHGHENGDVSTPTQTHTLNYRLYPHRTKQEQ